MTAESLFGCATPTTAQAASFHTNPPTPPLEHSPPAHRHIHPPPSQLCCAKLALKDSRNPMSSSGKSMNLEAVHASRPKKRN